MIACSYVRLVRLVALGTEYVGYEFGEVFEVRHAP